MVRDRAGALALQRRGLRDWIGLLGASSEGATVFERDGVIAAIVPRCPQRSICNSASFDDAAALEATLEELALAYEEAGVAAWTVWAPEFDSHAIDVLEAAGHAFDGAPLAMSLDFDRYEPPELGDLDWDTDVDPADLGRLNDLAYGLPPESGLARGLSAPPQHPGLRLYQARGGGDQARGGGEQARGGGEPVCVLGTIDHGADLGFYFVATHPDHRGLGLASRLMAVALAAGRQRGLETASLQGSPMGQPVYARLGFEPDFVIRMYERRRG